jgi:hypothetical protein
MPQYTENDALQADPSEFARTVQLDKIIYLDGRSNWWVTPLTLACKYEKFEMARILLERGADPNATMRMGDTVLHLCCTKASIEFVLSLPAIDVNTQTYAYLLPELCETGRKNINPKTEGRTALENSVQFGILSRGNSLLLLRAGCHLRKNRLDLTEDEVKDRFDALQNRQILLVMAKYNIMPTDLLRKIGTFL